MTTLIPAELLAQPTMNGVATAAPPAVAVLFADVFRAVSGEFAQDVAGNELPEADLFEALNALELQADTFALLPGGEISPEIETAVQDEGGNDLPPSGYVLPLAPSAPERVAVSAAALTDFEAGDISKSARAIASQAPTAAMSSGSGSSQHAVLITPPARELAAAEAKFAPAATPPFDVSAEVVAQVAQHTTRELAVTKRVSRDTVPSSSARPEQPGARAEVVLDTLSRLLEPVVAPRPEPAPFESQLAQALQRDITASPAAPTINPVSSTAIAVNLTSQSAGMPAANGELRVVQPMSHEAWSEAFAERVSFATRLNVQQAEIRLNPPQLGPVEVRISVTQDQASVAFSSQHAVVREAIDAALPRLREALAESGLSLVNVDISDRSFAQERRPSGGTHDTPSGTSEWNEFELAPDAPAVLAAIAHGRLDCYA